MSLKSFAVAALIGLAAAAASAQPFTAPVAPGATVVQSDRMLAAIARVPVGVYTNNEMLRITEARKANDVGALTFYLSHTNRESQSERPVATSNRPVNPMTADDPNEN